MASGKLKQSETPVVGLTDAKPPDCSFPVLICVWPYFGIPVSLYNENVLLADFHYGGF